MTAVPAASRSSPAPVAAIPPAAAPEVDPEREIRIALVLYGAYRLVARRREGK